MTVKQLHFSNNTPLAITDLSTVTSQIVVSGVNGSALDVNVRTFLRHTFPSDLDITITAPNGQVVTLTTDNGGGNDDVFNGTLWDDSANPGGKVPYDTNNGLVTDAAFVNGVVAPWLAPEGSLGKFNYFDPNGIWTITITDDAGGDVGTLDGWGLDFVTSDRLFGTSNTNVSNTTPVAIDAGAPNVVTSSIVVSGVDHRIAQLLMSTSIQHTFNGDLEITLTSPSGTVVTLTTGNGISKDDVFNGTTWWDGGSITVTDAALVNGVTASPLIPEEALAAFQGEDPNGVWILTIADTASGDGGSLNSWSLFINTLSDQDVFALNTPENDFNGDKTSDVLWRSTSSGGVSEWQLNGSKIVANQAVGTLDSSWQFLDSGDFNLDGRADALYRNSSSGQVVVWSLDGATINGNQSVGTIASSFKNQGTGDFNFDGHSDVLWRSDSGQVVLWSMDGAKIIGNQQVTANLGSNFKIQGLLDANGDGMTDVLLRDSTNGQVVLWTMNGATIMKNESVANLGLDFHVVGTGDFNGDSRDDILLRSDSGQVVVWTMDGKNIVGNESAGIISSNFRIEDIGDYSHDGKADILLRDTTNGQVVMWEMNGGTITSNHAVLTGGAAAVVSSDLQVLNHQFDLV